MSRDERGNRTQEVIGSIPFSSTNYFNQLAKGQTQNNFACATTLSALPRFRLALPLDSNDLHGPASVRRAAIQEVAGSNSAESFSPAVEMRTA
jgi:hypothetical protein